MPYDATKMKDWQISEAAEVEHAHPMGVSGKTGTEKG